MNVNAKHIQILLDRIDRGESCFKKIDEETNKEMTTMLRECLIRLKGAQS